MGRRWFKFETLDDEEFGLGTEEEACEYAAILNDHRGGKLCKPQALSRVQSFGLIVLVTANTFVISDALAATRDECLLGISHASASADWRQHSAPGAPRRNPELSNSDADCYGYRARTEKDQLCRIDS